MLPPRPQPQKKTKLLSVPKWQRPVSTQCIPVLYTLRRVEPFSQFGNPQFLPLERSQPTPPHFVLKPGVSAKDAWKKDKTLYLPHRYMVQDLATVWEDKEKFIHEACAIEQAILDGKYGTLVKHQESAPSRISNHLLVGSSEFSDEFEEEPICWPEGYVRHYLNENDVLPTERFYHYVLWRSELDEQERLARHTLSEWAADDDDVQSGSPETSMFSFMNAGLQVLTNIHADDSDDQDSEYFPHNSPEPRISDLENELDIELPEFPTPTLPGAAPPSTELPSFDLETPSTDAACSSNQKKAAEIADVKEEMKLKWSEMTDDDAELD